MAHKTGLEEYYVIRGQKKMRFGYTTGSWGKRSWTAFLL